MKRSRNKIEESLIQILQETRKKRKLFVKTMDFCMENLNYWLGRKQTQSVQFVLTLKKMSEDPQFTTSEMSAFILSNFFTIFKKSQH